MRPTFSRFGFLFAALAVLASFVHGQTLAFSISADTATNGGRQPFTGTIGLFFSLNAPLTIKSLGYWDDARDGLGVGTTITVAIFDRTATGSPIVSLPFMGVDGTLFGGIVANQLDSNPAGPSNIPGQFRLANLSTPVDLLAGQYALVAWGSDGSNQILNGSHDGSVLDIESFSGRLIFDGSAFDDHSGVYPTTLDPGGGVIIPLYVAATFSPDVVSAIPEPARVALALAATAMTGVFIARLRQRSRCPA